MANPGLEALSSMSRETTSKKNEQILAELLKDEANKCCADCGQKGTRWASWNIGVFLCIRCGGIHRKLGTHISKVKSVTLDTWTDEQVKSIQSKGNAIVNAMYNPDPSRFSFPSYSGDMEQYIRDKYERKLFMNPSQRSSVGPMALSSKGTSLEVEPVKTKGSIYTAKTQPVYFKQMQQLQDMGFTDKAKCTSALEATNGDVQACIDKLTSTHLSPKSKTFDNSGFDDLLGTSFSEPASKPAQSTSIGFKADNQDNGWDDFGISEEEEIKKVSTTTDAFNSAEESQKPATSQFSAWDPEPQEKLEPATTSSLFGKSTLFADQDDPFADLTHNPFK